MAGGTYTGAGGAVITVTKSITLYGGWDGADSGPVVRDPETYPTVLDGEGQRRVIDLDGGLGPITPTIEGFVIANGNAASAPFNSGRGGGIHSRSATPIIAHNVISGNVAGPATGDGRGYGGGIYLYNVDGTAVITANRIISNVANANGQGYGGGIFLSNAQAAQVINNMVLSNTAVITGGQGYGGGVALSSSPDVTMTGNEIAYNVAYRGPTWQSSGGGGVYCSSSHDLTFRDNVVRNNVVNKNATGGAGGGLRLRSCYRADITHNRFEGNASSHGGGLHTYAAHDLTLEANCFLGNSAYLGGGLYLGHNTWFTMTNNIVAENVGGYEGGGMAFEAW
ncbi:MAG: right-handed parallel beta-helix repeat-containing protein, partial [Clostridia bacterium]|nr:right-handed parallel beta-helix repeat-containing protein [Clostridia bacterium]